MALHMLEQSEVALARGGALAWLLDRALEGPVVSVQACFTLLPADRSPTPTPSA